MSIYQLNIKYYHRASCVADLLITIKIFLPITITMLINRLSDMTVLIAIRLLLESVANDISIAIV